MLTKSQKLAIIRYISGFSTKPIMEDVDEIDLEQDQIWEDVEEFLEECKQHMQQMNCKV